MLHLFPNHTEQNVQGIYISLTTTRTMFQLNPLLPNT